MGSVSTWRMRRRPSIVIAGNRIGTDAAGTAAVGNRLYGIVVSSGGNTIGGTSAADRNLISGNGRGIMFIGSSAASNDVFGNYIGTNAAGTSALSNGIHGIVFNVAGAGNQIGGAGAGEGNVIAASGVGVEFVATSDQVVQGNRIGVGADGTTPLGNPSIGIHISGTPGFASDNNQIGGISDGEGNVIADSGQEGIRIEGTASGNSILGNSIHDNTGLGIDLAANGVTPNDVGDADTGPNGLQNFPLITAATLIGSTISGTMSGNPGDSFRIEVFESPTCDGSGNGEGARRSSAQTRSPAPAPWAIDAQRPSATR